MKNAGVSILLFLTVSIALIPLLEETIAQQVTVVNAPPLIPSSILFRQITLEVKAVNSTYAQFRLTAWIANPSNQTLSYVAEVTPSTSYRTYYAFAPSPPPVGKPRASFGAEVTSERFGKLNVTKDGVAARAASSLEANGDDRIRMDGWMILTQVRRMIWREYVEDYLSFSIRPVAEYVVAPSSEARIEVKMLYPAEYTRTDEANNLVEVVNGYKVISYSDQFYGGYGLSFNLYKSRVPVNSLIAFLALWALLIVAVIKVRKMPSKRA